MVHPACETESELLKDCSITFRRRSGPGGQHRNKTETAVVIEHLPTGLRGEASERRSQAENRKLALFRLRLALATETRQNSRQEDPISALWRSRLDQQRLVISHQHTDFPSLLAEALDRMAANEYQLDIASAHLLVTPTQLVKLLKQHHPALDKVNHLRQERGLGVLK